jgi:cobalamin synthase
VLNLDVKGATGGTGSLLLLLLLLLLWLALSLMPVDCFTPDRGVLGILLAEAPSAGSAVLLLLVSRLVDPAGVEP